MPEKIVRWKCSRGHYHKTESSAEACERPPNREAKQMNDRYAVVYCMVSRGCSLKEAGEAIGVSRERARQMALRVEYELKKDDDDEKYGDRKRALAAAIEKEYTRMDCK